MSIDACLFRYSLYRCSACSTCCLSSGNWELRKSSEACARTALHSAFCLTYACPIALSVALTTTGSAPESVADKTSDLFPCSSTSMARRRLRIAAARDTRRTTNSVPGSPCMPATRSVSGPFAVLVVNISPTLPITGLLMPGPVSSYWATASALTLNERPRSSLDMSKARNRSTRCPVHRRGNRVPEQCAQ